MKGTGCFLFQKEIEDLGKMRRQAVRTGKRLGAMDWRLAKSPRVFETIMWLKTETMCFVSFSMISNTVLYSIYELFVGVSASLQAADRARSRTKYTLIWDRVCLTCRGKAWSNSFLVWWSIDVDVHLGTESWAGRRSNGITETWMRKGDFQINRDFWFAWSLTYSLESQWLVCLDQDKSDTMFAFLAAEITRLKAAMLKKTGYDLEKTVSRFETTWDH